MPMSRSQKTALRGQKSPKSGSNATGDGMKAAKSASKAPSKPSPKKSSAEKDSDGDRDNIKMII